MNVAEANKQFLEHLEVDCGRSAKTIENYGRYLSRFITFGKLKKSTDITEQLVRDFSLFLSRQGGTKVGVRHDLMKIRTQNYHLIALRTFLKFLRKRKINSLPPESIKLAKVSKRPIDLVTSAELKRLCAAPDRNTLEGKRDSAIIELLVATGLRVSELCNLSVDDVDLTRGELSVGGADGKVRAVFLSNSAKAAVQDYLAARSDTDEALFVRYGHKENVGKDRRLIPRGVQRLLKHYAAKAGIVSRLTPHVLRHSFAAAELKNGTDLREVQALLGHSHLANTKIYTSTIQPREV